MIEKVYMANILPGLSIEDQAAKLAGITSVYVDKLGPAALAARDPAALKDRAKMLKPTSRADGETIRVVDLHVLAWTWQDLCDVIAQAGARNATIIETSTGLVIEPSEGIAALAKRLPAFASRSRTRGLRKTLDEVAAERRADTQRRIELIREDWAKPHADFPTAVLLLRAGVGRGKKMAYATAKHHLGERAVAQDRLKGKQRQAAGRRAGAPPGRKPKL